MEFALLGFLTGLSLILAIGAHFDDIELGCGGSIAKHAIEGDNVYAYVATVSGFSNPYSKSVRKNSIAKKEGKAAMNVLGIKKLYTGNFETLKVEFNEKFTLSLLKPISSITHLHTVFVCSSEVLIKSSVF